MESPSGLSDEKKSQSAQDEENTDTLKYQLLGPSLTKAGQDAVDQQKVSNERRSQPLDKQLTINCTGL